ncbi:MAG TPA: hypothetical protein VGT78_01515 [Rhizomicrobium sp.]|nr:hypothetical protein [Rhizomicrobium sp.]
MVTRTTSKSVEFRRPFLLNGFERVEPAGIYTVNTEEDMIDALSFPAWRRIATTMQFTRAGATEYVTVDPDELHEALMRDGAQPNALLPCFVPPSAKRKRVRDALRMGHLTGRRE